MQCIKLTDVFMEFAGLPSSEKWKQSPQKRINEKHSRGFGYHVDNPKCKAFAFGPGTWKSMGTHYSEATTYTVLATSVRAQQPKLCMVRVKLGF